MQFGSVAGFEAARVAIEQIRENDVRLSAPTAFKNSTVALGSPLDHCEAWKPTTAFGAYMRASFTMQCPSPIEIVAQACAVRRVGVDDDLHGRRVLARLLLGVGPEVGLEVHDGGLAEHGDALEQQLHVGPVRLHECVVGEAGEVAVAVRGHLVQREHRHDALGVGRVGHDVHERAVGFHVGQPPFVESPTRYA